MTEQAEAALQLIDIIKADFLDGLQQLETIIQEMENREQIATNISADAPGEDMASTDETGSPTATEPPAGDPEHPAASYAETGAKSAPVPEPANTAEDDRVDRAMAAGEAAAQASRRSSKIAGYDGKWGGAI